MGMIAYPPVYDAKRITKPSKPLVEYAGQSGAIRAQLIERAAKWGREDAERKKLERYRAGLMAFKQRFMPEWARQIIEEVSQKRGVCPSELARDCRKHKVILARNEAIYLVKSRKPMLSSPRIAGWFGKDHTSILHSLASYSAATGMPKLVGYDLSNARERNRRVAAERLRKLKEAA